MKISERKDQQEGWISTLFEHDFNTVDKMFTILPGLRKYFNGLEDGQLRTGLKTCPVLPLDKVVRYIVLLYRNGSDLFDEYPTDVDLRKDAAAAKAGFERIEVNGEDVWPDHLKQIIDYRNKHVNAWIFDFLKTQNPIWREIQYLDREIEALYEQRDKALEDETLFKNRGKQTDYYALIKEKSDQKETLLKRFYNDYEGLRDATELEMLPITPENVFLQLQVPEQYTKVMQIKDVPRNQRLDKISD